MILTENRQNLSKRNSSDDIYDEPRGDYRNQNNREQNGSLGFVLWLTGLSGSGKSSTALKLKTEFEKIGYNVVVLDGDRVRRGLCKDLGFLKTDRSENNRRVAEVSKLFLKEGYIVICSLISPYEEDRIRSRSIIPKGKYVEVFLKCSLEVCEQRETKGNYCKARSGEIRCFTGISDSYETPILADLVVDTESSDLAESIDQIMVFLENSGYIKN